MPCVCVGLDPVSWGRYQREASTVLIASAFRSSAKRRLKHGAFSGSEIVELVLM